MYKYLRYILLLIVLTGVSAWFVVYNRAGKITKPDTTMHVTASFYPLYFFAVQIGNGIARVTTITPAGVEPHDYEPTASDIAQIANSRLVIMNGKGLEAWSSKLKDVIDPQRTVTVIASQDMEGSSDPHVWLDPRRARLVAQKIFSGFIQADPENKAIYKKNLEALLMRLDALDNEFTRGLKNCLKTDIVTSHDAFGYLAKTYGLHQVPIAGLSPDSEPSTRQMAQIARFAKENDVGYIFFENLASPKLAKTIAAEANIKTLVLDPLEGLSEDDRKAGKDYFSVMRRNLTNLRLALSCK